MPSGQRPVFAAAIAHADVRHAWNTSAGDRMADREHALDGNGTLCGLAVPDVDVYRHLFGPRAYVTCQVCRAEAARALLREGMTCVAARQVLWVDDNGERVDDGFEMSFDDGSVVGFTVRPDWSLTMSGDLWSTVDTQLRLTEVEPGDDALRRIVGQPVVGREAHLNDVGEFQGFDITFPRSVVRVGQRGGELTVEVEPL